MASGGRGLDAERKRCQYAGEKAGFAFGADRSHELLEVVLEFKARAVKRNLRLVSFNLRVTAFGDFRIFRVLGVM